MMRVEISDSSRTWHDLIEDSGVEIEASGMPWTDTSNITFDRRDEAVLDSRLWRRDCGKKRGDTASLPVGESAWAQLLDRLDDEAMLDTLAAQGRCP